MNYTESHDKIALARIYNLIYKTGNQLKSEDVVTRFISLVKTAITQRPPSNKKTPETIFKTALNDMESLIEKIEKENSHSADEVINQVEEILAKVEECLEKNNEILDARKRNPCLDMIYDLNKKYKK